MSRPFSIYLDAIRFIAALAVFLTHLSTENILRVDVISRFGHDAVVVFFVLSGCVIAYATEIRDRDFRTYAINRLARMWSVVIPALCLTVVLEFGSGRQALAPGGFHGHSFLPLLANALFVNQLWFLNLAPWSDTPFWSLGFEVWYYVLFAAATYITKPHRVFWILVIALIVGPKILIMLPVWLLGVLVYRWRPRWGEIAGWALFIGSGVIYLVYRWVDFTQAAVAISHFLHVENSKFGMAYYFASDYVVGTLVAMNFLGFRMVEHRFASLLHRCTSAIRFLASFTFSLYLFHVPVIDFLGQRLGKGSYLTPVIAIVTIVCLGSVTEKRKDVVRRCLVHVVEHAEQAFVRVRPLRVDPGS